MRLRDFAAKTREGSVPVTPTTDPPPQTEPPKPAAFQWLRMRISEEQDRRTKEARTLARLPDALRETHDALVSCVDAYNQAFGGEAATIQLLPHSIRVTAREERDGKWEPSAEVEVVIVEKLPGLRVERTGPPLEIEVGILPGGNLFYRDGDKYLTMDDLTRRILDKALFPKLGE